MSNIYFPDEELTYNDLYFVCYMIERTARHVKQPNEYVVQHLGREGLERQLSIADVQHSLNPEDVVAGWVDEYNLQNGSTDVTKVDTSLTEHVPTDLQMGKVYARLITSTLQPDENWADAIIRVYESPICHTLDNYNTGAYYEPSYTHTRAYLQGAF